MLPLNRGGAENAKIGAERSPNAWLPTDAKSIPLLYLFRIFLCDLGASAAKYYRPGLTPWA